MLKNTAGLRSFLIKGNGGVDEVSAVTDVSINKFLEMKNWRLSDDGKRIEKRDGSAAVATSATFGNKKIFAYHTYYDSTPAFCQLVVAEDKVWRKIASASWASILTWGTTLAHPVKPIEIQGKQIVVTENENFQILPDGTKVNFGIAAPTTLPTLTEGYNSTLLNEDMAAIADWSDGDTGSGASTQITYDSKSTMKLLNTGSSGDAAIRYRTISNVGSRITIEFSLYLHTIGTKADTNQFQLDFYNGEVLAQIRIDRNDLYVYSGAYWVSAGMKIEEDQWIEFRFHYNTENPDDQLVEIYADGNSHGAYSIANKDTTNAGKVQIALYGESVATQAYVDYMKIGDSSSGELNGRYRYAVTYARNGGNYPAESNPIKSIIGAATFTGAGLDDCTPSGTFTGSKEMKYRIEIDGTTPDTIKISYDNGNTWVVTGLPLATSMYLSYGIKLAFGATTGHTLTERWDFTCSALVANPCHQKVSLTSLPTSSDTQVDQRRVYRTTPGGNDYYLVLIINDNTTTSFVDNLPDGALGSYMREDNDVPPKGKFFAWWDNRLWIVDEDENIIYYSRANKPDAFDLDSRYISARRGKSNDSITGAIVYKSKLWIMKNRALSYVRRKLSAIYSLYEACTGYGVIAPWSLFEAYDLLTFLSYRGWEVFNGCTVYHLEFSFPIRKTLRTIDKTELDLVCAGHLSSKGEIWLSLPERTGGASAVTAVMNYARGVFYFFEFHKTPASFFEIEDTDKEVQLVMGTTDGNVFTCNSGTQDGTTNITATARLPWIVFDEYTHARYLEIEYECPTDKALTLGFYTNFDKDVVKTTTFAGSTPSSTDQSIRLPIKSAVDFQVRGKYLGMKLTNAENVGSSLKINWMRVFYASLARKKEIKAD